jgi:hypothetical protein
MINVSGFPGFCLTNIGLGISFASISYTHYKKYKEEKE